MPTSPGPIISPGGRVVDDEDDCMAVAVRWTAWRDWSSDCLFWGQILEWKGGRRDKHVGHQSIPRWTAGRVVVGYLGHDLQQVLDDILDFLLDLFLHQV